MKAKLMKFLEKKLINKYKGAAITAVSTAAVTFLVSKFGSAPESVQGVIKFILGVISDGQITEITPITMTTIITPFVAAVVAYIINWRQASAIEKIQAANGEIVDGWAGEKTIVSATKK